MDDPVDLRDPIFCDRVARHLSEMAVDLAAVETCLERLITEPSYRDANATLIPVQRIDHLQQRLADLATMFGALASDDSTIASLSKELKLAETRALLDGHAQRGAVQNGEVDLF